MATFKEDTENTFCHPWKYKLTRHGPEHPALPGLALRRGIVPL